MAPKGDANAPRVAAAGVDSRRVPWTRRPAWSNVGPTALKRRLDGTLQTGYDVLAAQTGAQNPRLRGSVLFCGTRCAEVAQW